MKYIKLLLLLLVLAEVQTAFAQGWTVTGSYTYDMTVTAVLNVNCTELNNPSNQIGAFVNGEVRGSALSSTVVKGRYVALLTIRSNVTSAESVSFKIYNAATGDVIDAATKILFQDDAVYGTPSDPYDIRSNNAPVNISLATRTTQESVASSLITAISVTDADATDTHTYSLVSGVGSTDNSTFTIVGNSLYSTGGLNYDTQSKYKIRIQAADNRGCTVSDTFTITVTDKNFAPTDIQLSVGSIDENKSSGSTVGTFTSVDMDKTDVFSYKLVSGTGSDDNGSFSISGSTLLTSAVFDYETKASYKIRVQTKDSGNNTYEKEFVIAINNTNDKPVVNDQTLSVDEYAPNGQVLGNVAGTDADISQTLSYSFYNPTNPPQTVFGINSSTGEISLLSNTLNYQTTKSYTLQVIAKDNGTPILSDTATLIIFVLYQNFSPTDISISNASVKENSAAVTKVGEFASADKNTGDTFAYALVSGTGADDNSKFSIAGNILSTSSVFDYETKASYTIRVQTKDSGNNTFEKVFAISVSNVNDNPDLTDKTLGIDEKAPNGTVLGTMTATDPDAGQILSYSFVNTTPPQTIFGINSTTGQVTLLSNTLNYKTTQSYTLKVVAVDNGSPALSDTATLTIVVLYQNYAPTDISISNTKIKENIAIGTKVADLATFDRNTGDVFTYSFIDGVNADDNGSFTITGSSLFTNSAIDYEIQTTYNIRVQTKDLSGNLFQKAFVITVTNLNEQPNLQDQVMTVAEDVTAGTVIGTMTATDEDNFQVLSYYIVNEGLPQTKFKIDKLTGDVSVLVSNFDYTSTPSYTLKIAVWDSGTPSLSDTATLQIQVVDQNYPPTDLLISNDNINENKPANTTVAVFSSVDKDLGETFIYSFVSGANSSDNGMFLIKGDSLLAKASFNYEKQTSYNITVQTKDSGGNTFEKTFTISINDLNEKPALANQTVGVEENSKSGTSICTFIAIDEDKAQHLTYAFIGTTTSNIVKLDPVTGEVVLMTNALDYEKVKSYTFQVGVTDDGNPIMSDTATLVIKVLDVVEGTLASVDYVSANGDGKNDYWVIENVDLYSDYKLMIFDANGIMVYSIDSGYDNSWNGIYHGSQLPIGAYYYVLSNNSDGSKSFKGTITLVR